MLQSVKQISAIAGTNRETVQKRADQLGLIAQPGEKGAKLYDTRALLRLVPPPGSMDSSDGTVMTREQAAARKDSALAEKTELEVAKLKGRLADVYELLDSQNPIFEEIVAVVKKSTLSDTDKEDILSIIQSVPQKCWGENYP